MKIDITKTLLKPFFITLLFVSITACPRETLHDGLSVGIDEDGVFFINEKCDSIIINTIIIYTGGDDIMFSKTFVDVEDKTKIKYILLENQGSRQHFLYNAGNPYRIMTSKGEWRGTVTLLHKDGRLAETVDFADSANMKVILTIETAGHEVVSTKEAFGESFFK